MVERDPRVVGKYTVFENDFARFGIKTPFGLIATGVMPEIKEPIEEGSLLAELAKGQVERKPEVDKITERTLQVFGASVKDVLDIALLLRALGDPAQEVFLFFSPMQFRWHGKTFLFSVDYRAGKLFHTRDHVPTDSFFKIRNAESGEVLSFSGALPETLSRKIDLDNLDVHREEGSVSLSLVRMLRFFGF